MEEQLISFETAKLAKEQGFTGLCSNIYTVNGKIDELVYYEGNNSGKTTNQDLDTQYFNEYDDKILCTASTQSLLAKWLREVHNCFIDILPHKDGDSENKQWKSKKDVFWSVEVDYYGKNFEIELTDDSDFTQHFNNSYEEALEIGLQEALKLIK